MNTQNDITAGTNMIVICIQYENIKKKEYMSISNNFLVKHCQSEHLKRKQTISEYGLTKR